MSGPTTLPDTGFVRLPTVLAHVPFSRAKLYAEIKAGKFPPQIKLSPRIAVWRAEDVRAWMDAKQPEAAS